MGPRIYTPCEWPKLGCAQLEESELSYYRNIGSIEEAISAATHAVVPNTAGTDTIVHSHFRNKQEHLFNPAERVLLRAKQKLNAAEDFHRLHTEVLLALTGGPTPVLKPQADTLYAYDVALWIGAFRNLSPDRIYLHRGTRRGAERLTGRDLSGRSTLPVEVLPPDWQGYPCHQIESMLCAYWGPVA